MSSSPPVSPAYSQHVVVKLSESRNLLSRIEPYQASTTEPQPQSPSLPRTNKHMIKVTNDLKIYIISNSSNNLKMKENLLCVGKVLLNEWPTIIVISVSEELGLSRFFCTQLIKTEVESLFWILCHLVLGGCWSICLSQSNQDWGFCWLGWPLQPFLLNLYTSLIHLSHSREQLYLVDNVIWLTLSMTGK